MALNPQSRYSGGARLPLLKAPHALFALSSLPALWPP